MAWVGLGGIDPISEVLLMVKFSPTALNYGYDFVLFVHFLRQPVALLQFSTITIISSLYSIIIIVFQVTKPSHYTYQKCQNKIRTPCAYVS